MPKYEVGVDMPNLPRGHTVEIPPVGVVENGSSVEAELTEEQAEFVSNAWGVIVKDGSGNEVKVRQGEGQEEGSVTNPDPDERAFSGTVIDSSPEVQGTEEEGPAEETPPPIPKGARRSKGGEG
jgi:hypothetical protein